MLNYKYTCLTYYIPDIKANILIEKLAVQKMSMCKS